jgi:hypothetical protein
VGEGAKRPLYRKGACAPECVISGSTDHMPARGVWE